ncbi:MAG: DUF3606 domain-containing protein [Hyphomicrobiales bacterium]
MALIAIPVPADPTLVNVRERLEVEYRCQEWGCTEEELLDAVASVGDAAAQVEAFLINEGHKRKASLSLDGDR